MTWHVEYTDDAVTDLDNIRVYITDTLLEPVISENQIMRIMDAVDSLEHMPLRYRLYSKEPWRARGLRVMPVDNYIIFYLPVESKMIVYIVRIMYGGRDYNMLLSE